MCSSPFCCDCARQAYRDKGVLGVLICEQPTLPFGQGQMAAAADASERDAADDGYIEADLSKDDVVSKYRQAADIVNNAIKGVLKRCVPGADVLELCILGDKLIDMQVSVSLLVSAENKGFMVAKLSKHCLRR